MSADSCYDDKVLWRSSAKTKLLPLRFKLILLVFLKLVIHKILLSPWTQDVNWTYIRCSEDVQDVFWTSYVRSIYVQGYDYPNLWFWSLLLAYLLYSNPKDKRLKVHSLKPETIFGNWKPFKCDEKCFLFHLKSSFCSQGI